MAVVSFAVYSALGGVLTPEVAFSSLALFNVIKLPLFFFPAVLQVVIEANVSYRRVQKFLALEESTYHVEPVADPRTAIQVQDATFQWAAEETQQLTNINFSIRKGDLVCVVGETGSGKSSLLMGLLGEMVVTTGTVNRTGSVGFVSQQPWIFKGTIRDNILFGRPFDSQRYAETISVCQLMRDLENFAAGDQQEVGEQGVGLSGGQKQRLSLARAVYADADIYLFDDSLSAVDARVGRALFNECIVGFLANKTRLLVCNQLHFTPQADQIFVMRGGQIVEQGPPQELLGRGSVYSAIMQDYVGWMEEQDDVDEEEIPEPPGPQIVGDLSSVQYRVTGEDADDDDTDSDEDGDDKEREKATQGGEALGIKLLLPEEGGDGEDGSSKVQVDNGQEDSLPAEDVTPSMGEAITTPADRGPNRSGRMILEEARAEGTTLTAANIMSYVGALGGLAVLLQCSFVYALLECCRLGNVFWLAWWSEGRWDLAISSWLGVYALWSVGQSACSLINLMFLAHRGVQAARNLHDTMLLRIIKAPILFFDSTPIGRIVNRFSKDQRLVDTGILPTVSLCLSALANLVSTVIVVGINTPYTFIVFVPISFIFLQTQAQYRRAAREIKRMESTTRSPVYSQFGETLTGMATIRAYEAQTHMETINSGHLLNNQRFQWAGFALNRWLSMKLEFLGGIIILSAGCFAVLQSNQLGAPLLGLTLSQTFQVTGLLSLLNRLFADLENAFTSVERIKEYQEVAQESDVATTTPPPTWPTQGCITFENVEMRYRPDIPPSLKGVTFQIRPAEKVGVVGRTGAGKSTLLVALYRLSELTSGTIYIDGVDISQVDLATLRQAISIIPQTPILFTGTIRYNLDPFQQRTDAEIWRALGQANLTDVVEVLPGKLDFKVAEGGESFSVGQRQLLCLARALLRRSKILMIDEATANIDPSTDNLIQETIRTQFQDCTTITIAHRLNTIIDSDRVLVLSYGWMMQFDTPAKLLAIPHPQPSIFRDLVEETGEASANYLRSVAMSRVPLRRLALPKDEKAQVGTFPFPDPEPKILPRPADTQGRSVHDEAIAIEAEEVVEAIREDPDGSGQDPLPTTKKSDDGSTTRAEH
uniref:ATP-dependent transporter ycf16 n=1 Tax=Eutreptiella gymnastica TaxID=73025 RepID=A0A7S1NHE9_9EUGL